MSVIKKENGKAIWTHLEGDTYIATGVDRNGKRFKRTGPWGFIGNINIWRGSKWLVRNGKRYLIQRAFN